MSQDEPLPEQVQDAIAVLIGFVKYSGGRVLRVPIRCIHGDIQWCVVVANGEKARTLDSFMEFEETVNQDESGEDNDEI
jgi:hypothetical protein